MMNVSEYANDVGKKVSEIFCGKKYSAAVWTQGWRQIH